MCWVMAAINDARALSNLAQTCDWCTCWLVLLRLRDVDMCSTIQYIYVRLELFSVDSEIVTSTAGIDHTESWRTKVDCFCQPYANRLPPIGPPYLWGIVSRSNSLNSLQWGTVKRCVTYRKRKAKFMVSKWRFYTLAASQLSKVSLSSNCI